MQLAAVTFISQLQLQESCSVLPNWEVLSTDTSLEALLPYYY
jgi:hypothetical protein